MLLLADAFTKFRRIFLVTTTELILTSCASTPWRSALFAIEALLFITRHRGIVMMFACDFIMLFHFSTIRLRGPVVMRAVMSSP